jgi:hypothetical protein
MSAERQPSSPASTDPRPSAPAASWGGEAAAALLGAAALGAKVAADAGGPRGLLTAIQVAAIGLVGFLAADPRRRRWLDARRAVLVSLAVLLVPTVYGEVGGDGWQAFVVVRSALLDQDLDLANDYAGLGAPVVATDAGRPTSHLPIGLALLWVPPFLLAHLGTTIAHALGAAVPADGFSVPYRSAATAGTYAYGAIALLLMEGELRRRQGAAVALLAVLAIWLVTPLHFYMTANPAMAHGVSVFAATAFVVSWLRVREKGAGPRAWALVGLLGGLMTLVRLQDAVLLALPAADLVWRRPRGGGGALARFSAAAAALGLVQLLVWLRLYGGDFVSTVLSVNLVGGSAPHVAGVLFSARHGLFYWTPLYVACLLGWIAGMRRDRVLAVLTLAGFAASVLVNASLQDWWGAEAFGQRRLLGLTPLFALGLGEALSGIPGRLRAVTAVGLAALALWTLTFEGIYNAAVVAPRDQAITYGRLAVAQVEVLRRRVVALHGRVPPAAWVRAYDALGGTWVDGRIDIGDEPAQPPFLVGRGWYDPEREGDVTLRRSRGPGSWLRVPLRAAGDYEVAVRLRPEMTDVPLRVTLEVNREPVSAVDVTPGWSEYRFAVPSRLVRAGLNDLGLLYSTTPRTARPEAGGRNAAVAVDWIALRPGRP